MQRGLAMLHRMTAILPSDKVLDGEVRRLDDLAVAGGSSSDIWRGLWLEEEKVLRTTSYDLSRLMQRAQVALKGMRNVRIDDKDAQKVGQS